MAPVEKGGASERVREGEREKEREGDSETVREGERIAKGNAMESWF